MTYTYILIKNCFNPEDKISFLSIKPDYIKICMYIVTVNPGICTLHNTIAFNNQEIC